jgi:prepilin-type N-terminal cleavage/methylation domain-containing protein
MPVPLSRGVTLVEMLIVVAIVGLMAGISFPAVSSGLETIRLSAATDSLVSFLNSALNRAERRQQVVEVLISVKDNAVWLNSTEAGFVRKLEMPAGVTIQAVWPKLNIETDEPRRFLLLPGSTVPRVGIEISNRRGTRRIVRVDPIIGVPQIENVETQ